MVLDGHLYRPIDADRSRADSERLLDWLRILPDPLDGTPASSPYKMGKAELQILNLRHLQHHVGQLSELLLSRGFDIEWAGMA